MIPCIVSLVLGAVFFVYDQQPYGNMDILPAAKQDMSVVKIVTELKLSDKDTSASIYKSVYAEDKAYIQSIQSGLSELENVTFSGVTRRKDENYVYNGKDMYGNEFQMNFFFCSGQWSYTTYTESVDKLTEETAQQYRNRYETWMKENKLLPDSAVFSVQNNNILRWEAAPRQDISAGDKAFQNGSVMMRFDENGTLVDLSYQISWNEYVATEDIISPKEAYVQVEDGNFEQYVPFQQGDVLHIEECELTYIYDTKGFYQPVYQFGGYVNNTENPWVCQIPALEN